MRTTPPQEPKEGGGELRPSRSGELWSTPLDSAKVRATSRRSVGSNHAVGQMTREVVRARRGSTRCPGSRYKSWKRGLQRESHRASRCGRGGPLQKHASWWRGPATLGHRISEETMGSRRPTGYIMSSCALLRVRSFSWRWASPSQYRAALSSRQGMR